jgi:hypothetical protein
MLQLRWPLPCYRTIPLASDALADESCCEPVRPPVEHIAHVVDMTRDRPPWLHPLERRDPILGCHEHASSAAVCRGRC